MKSTWTRIALVLLLATSGCASLDPDSRPEVSLVGLDVRDITPFQTTLELELRVLNPSTAELVVDGASFAAVLGHVKIGRGVSGQVLTIPRLDSKTMKIAFHVNNIALVSRLIPAFEQGEIGYSIKSSLNLQGALNRRVKQESTGVFDLEDPAGLVGRLGASSPSSP